MENYYFTEFPKSKRGSFKVCSFYFKRKKYLLPKKELIFTRSVVCDFTDGVVNCVIVDHTVSYQCDLVFDQIHIVGSGQYGQ